MQPALSNGQSTDHRRGQVLVIFSLFLVVLILTTALAVDYGSWLKFRRDYQNAADAAALAGSSFLTRPIDPGKRTLARQAAWTSLRDQLGLTSVNPITAGASDTPTATPVVSNDYRMWVSTPPVATGPGRYPGARTAPDDRTIFVWVEHDNPAYFSRIAGIGSKNMAAWATAGVFPNRFAVITLRRPGEAGPSTAEDILLAGNNSGLEVISGDVGGNWGMRLNAGSHLWLRGQGNNDADVYLTNYVSCGSSCWNVGQISSGDNGTPANVNKDAQPLPGFIDDPNFPLPTAISGAPATAQSPALPIGDLAGSVDVRNGGPNAAPGGATRDAGGVLRCDPTSPRIGPGFYSSIQVRQGKCLILDPVARHTSTSAAIPDVATPLLPGQMPGVFYVNGSIDVATDAMIVGDGVSVFIRPAAGLPGGNRLLASGGASVDLNSGFTPGLGQDRKRGAWTTSGLSTWSCDASMSCTYNTALNSQPEHVGVALYVIKRVQFNPSVPTDDNTDVIKINADASLTWSGVTYAPHDNVELSGQPGHNGIGQLVSWTFKFAGGTDVRQEYDGLDRSTPRLIEPTLGQP